MILMAVLDSVCEEHAKFNPTPGLTEALVEIQYLVDHGNEFARERLHEIKKLWKVMSQKIESLQAVNVSPIATGNGIHGADQVDAPVLAPPANGDVVLNPDGTGLIEGQSLRPEESPEDLMLLDTDLWDNFSHLWVPTVDNTGENTQQDNTMADFGPDEVFKFYHSMYNNPDWSLTGEDFEDFAELGRHIQDN